MLMEEEETGVLVFVSSIWKCVSHSSLKLCELFVINALTETVIKDTCVVGFFIFYFFK